MIVGAMVSVEVTVGVTEGVDDAQSCETANARVTPARCRALRSFRRQYGDRLDLEEKVVARELTHLHRG
jgi:hypothetical protein